MKDLKIVEVEAENGKHYWPGRTKNKRRKCIKLPSANIVQQRQRRRVYARSGISDRQKSRQSSHQLHRLFRGVAMLVVNISKIHPSKLFKCTLRQVPTKKKNKLVYLKVAINIQITTHSLIIEDFNAKLGQRREGIEGKI